MTDSQREALAAFASPGLPRLLFVTHAWGGGVEQHVQTLAKITQKQARVMILRPDPDYGDACIRLSLPEYDISFQLAATNWQALVDVLNTLRFTRLHMHHVHGLPRAILDLDAALGLPLDCTLHDYASICPQYQCVDPDGRYCGEPDNVGCNQCIQARPHAWNLDIEQWRAEFATVLSRASRVFAPSTSVEQRIHRYFPHVSIIPLPHPEPVIASPTVVKVVLIGALSNAKGLSVARDVAAYARRIGSPLQLRLVGHAAEPLPDAITATGSYNAEDLPKLIAAERPDVIWLPSQVPETFSFTLSAAMATGLPIVASAIGALAERLQGIENAALVEYNASASKWHDALISASVSSPFFVKVADHSSERTDSVSNFLSVYVSDLPLAVAAADATRLQQVVAFSQANSSPRLRIERPLLNVFRIGVYGGHRESAHVVESALEMISPGETHIVGRAQYDALSRDYNELHASLVASERNLLAIQDQHDEESAKWHEAWDQAEDRAVAARAHIAHLEALREQQKGELQRLQFERDELWASTSWKITKPLRFAIRSARKVRHSATVAARLLPRVPVLLRGGIARYRRSGWKGIRDRLATEFREPEASSEIVLPDKAPIAITALSLPTSEVPEVSILIPVYGQHPTTFACLKSIGECPPSRPFEIIVMDDGSPEPAAIALLPVKGARVLRNETNLGFIGNVNAAAMQARGKWLIILNNDTIVRPRAFDALLDTFDTHVNVGLVGAKLLNADGTLQEAGGIVWRDGSAWNWGRNQSREDPRFNFVRDADYCSGAALAIARDLFKELGGFDTHYAPAYYEDTDLAFRIRSLGKRVLYQPAAEVFHIEGVSHGRDEKSGLKAYQATNAKKFFARWQQALLTHRENAVNPELEAHRGSRSNILVVEACMITPDQDSGSVRMLNLLRILKQEGHHVSFIADNLDGNPKYAGMLTSIGIEVLHGKFSGSVRTVLRDRGSHLDSIVFCRHYIASQYVDMVRELAPRARVIFDTVDLHFVREEREAALLNNAAMLRAAAATRAKELRVIARSDVTLVVSDFEKSLLSRVEPTARVEIISNIHHASGKPVSAIGRRGALFIGGFRHPPNIDAVQWYVREVLPRLRQIQPDIVTTIVGSNMPDDFYQLAQPGLEVLGFVEDTAPLLQRACVSIAPLRYGAGVKGKINEAMNHGIPVVATPGAVEGMHLQHEKEVLVAQDADAFAQAVVRLHSDDILWNELSAAGLANVRRHFSAEVALPTIRAVFTDR
jgi:O-antigen biosynthesis protein